MEQTNLINSTYRKNISSIQNNVSTLFTNENSVVKILCSRAKSVITSYEALNGELKFNGEVCFSVLFINENNEFITLKETEKFSGRIEDEKITVNFIPVFSSDVIELKTSFSGDEIRVNGVVETVIEGIISESINYYVSNNDNIITNSNFINYSSLDSNGQLNFNFAESFDCKDKINKVLFAGANAQICDYSLGSDYFTVEGVISVNFGFETGEDVKEIEQFTKSYRFKEELEKEGITKEGYLVLKTNIFDCDIKTEIIEKDGENTVNFEIPVLVDYVYLKPNTSEVVVDAYSLTNKLNLNIESFTVDSKNFTKCIEEKIDGQLIINDEAPRIIKIISYCGDDVSITNTIKDNDCVIVEGVASVNVIYLEEGEESERLNSVIVEVPFSVENPIDLNANDDVTSSAIIKDVDVKSRKGKEINIDMELCIKIDVFATTEEMALTSVQEGEVLTPKEACLQIYFARKGNTLWDISKGLVCRPEQILKQNPNINLPLNEDEKIVLFEGRDN